MASCDIPEELVGYGVLLQYKDPVLVTETWVSLAGTNDLEFPNDTTEAIDATANPTSGGLSGAYKKMIPSPVSALDSISYEMNFTWGQWQTLLAFKSSKRILEWRLVLQNPEQTYMAFCAWIAEMGGSIPMEDLVKASITLQPTGAPEWGTLN